MPIEQGVIAEKQQQTHLYLNNCSLTKWTSSILPVQFPVMMQQIATMPSTMPQAVFVSM
jgi:hypothetical protein